MQNVISYFGPAFCMYAFFRHAYKIYNAYLIV